MEKISAIFTFSDDEIRDVFNGIKKAEILKRYRPLSGKLVGVRSESSKDLKCILEIDFIYDIMDVEDSEKERMLDDCRIFKPVALTDMCYLATFENFHRIH